MDEKIVLYTNTRARKYSTTAAHCFAGTHILVQIQFILYYNGLIYRHFRLARTFLCGCMCMKYRNTIAVVGRTREKNGKEK